MYDASPAFDNDLSDCGGWSEAWIVEVLDCGLTVERLDFWTEEEAWCCARSLRSDGERCTDPYLGLSWNDGGGVL